jgi:hypothetical protein
MRLRIAEIHKHTTAHVLGYEAPEPTNSLSEAFLISRNDLAEILRVHTRRECGRTDEVREHHRDLPALKVGAGFRSLADAWADTTTPHGRLMLTVLGGLAEFERELIRSRTDEGRKRAQARGIRFGRKPALTPHQRREALARREAGEALVEIGRSYNVSHSTISRL